MAGIFKTLFKIIDAANEKIGNFICFLILPIMFAVGASTISRYFFNEPMTIIWPFVRQLFGAIVLLGAAYTLLNDGHIKVETLYEVLPPWMKLITRMTSLLCFLTFLGILTWQAVIMAKIALMLKETSSHIVRLPIYPFKVFIPIATFLFLIQGIAFYLRAKKPLQDNPSGERNPSDESQNSENPC